MLDISTLECMSLDILIPETAVPACIVGRFSKSRIAPQDIPEGRRLYPVVGGMGRRPAQGWTPPDATEAPETFIPKAVLGDERTADPPQEQTYGWFLTRNAIPDACLRIVNWSFYTA